MGSDNTREFSRIELQVAARLTCADGTEITGMVHDLSMNGVFIQTTGRTSAGQEGDLVLIFDPEESKIEIDCHARVIRAGDGGIAVQITEIELESYGHLRNLIMYNAPDPERVLDELEQHLGLKRRPEEGE